MSRLAALAALLALLFAGPAASAAAPVAHARASRPAPPGIGATIPAPVIDAKLQAALARIAANAPGRCGIVAIDLRTGRTARVHGIDRIPMASLSKLPVALAVLDAVDRQRFSLSLPVALRTAAHGEQLRTVHDLLEAMMVQSDDTACDALLGRVGGPRAVSVWLRRHRLPGIRIERTELERGNDWYGLTQGPLGGGAPAEVVQKLRDAVAPTERTTAAEAFLHDPRDTGSPAAFAELLSRLWRRQLLSPASTDTLLAMMLRARTGDACLRAGAPGPVRVHEKTGTAGTWRERTPCVNDVGVLELPSGEAVVIAVMIRDVHGPVANAERTIAAVAQAVLAALR